MRSRANATISQRLLVAPPRRWPATGPRRRRSTPPPSRGCRSRRGCAGSAASPRSDAGDPPRGGCAGTGPRRSARPSTSGPSRVSCGSRRARASLSSSSTGPSNCTTSQPSARITSHARPGERRHGLSTRVHAPRAAHAQVRVQREAARLCPWVRSAGTGACRGRPRRTRGGPTSRSGQRSRRWRGLGREDLLRHPPLQDRADPHRGVVDRVPLGHTLKIGWVEMSEPEPRARERLTERAPTPAGDLGREVHERGRGGLVRHRPGGPARSCRAARDAPHALARAGRRCW